MLLEKEVSLISDLLTGIKMTGVMIELVCSYWLDLRLLIVIRFNTAIICDLQILKGVIIALLSFRKDELTEARTGKKKYYKETGEKC